MKYKVEKVISIIFIILLIATPAIGKKKENKIKEIKTYLKSGNNLDQALKIVEQCTTDSLYFRNKELYELGISLSIKINDSENEKAYLKQKYDTVRFFTSIYNIFNYATKCDSLETLLNKEENEKYEYRNKNIAILSRYYKNLGIGGRFFYSKEQINQSEKMLSMFLGTWHSPLLTQKDKKKYEYLIPNTAYLYLKCNYQMKRYENVFRYESLALQDTTHNDAVIEFLAETSRINKDTSNLKKYLLQGLAKHPNNVYYYSSISGILLQLNRSKEVLELTDSLLKIRPNNELYIMGKSLALISLKRYDEAIKYSKQLISMDSTIVEPFYHIGLCYCNIAQNIILPINLYSPEYKDAISNVQKNYKNALPYMEMYRKMRPNDEARWAPLLYKIYLNLNMGKQFEEIETILSKNK